VRGIAAGLGLLRSYLLYRHPFAQRRLVRFYRRLLPHPGLAFDIGAHLGNRSRALLTLGFQVVALEPQPAFARRLEALARRCPRLIVLPMAAAGQAGRLRLMVPTRVPTVATASAAFRALMQAKGVDFDGEIEVEATTLDHLIARFGQPDFIKIDAEGMEVEILEGLSRPVAVLAFEHLPERPEATFRCIQRLAALGRFRFDFVAGERTHFTFGQPLAAEAFLAALAQPPLTQAAGDVYAFAEAEGDAA
jgi:FkbM family methyltransferase